MDNRKVFFEELIKLAKQDDKIVLIVCDVGFSFTEEFQKKFPNRYFNFGVTEQSSMIIAAAMALSGLKPYIYSMINFMAFRPFEMVRNAIVMHKANVKIIGVKGSEKYKFYGFSHNMIFEDEDILLLSHYMKTYVPRADGLQSDVKQVLLKAYESDKPTYIRL